MYGGQSSEGFLVDHHNYSANYSANYSVNYSANYSACVVYTKTIIHLSVGESDGYLPPLR